MNVVVRPDQRNGDWMQTFTGRQFWPIDPRPEEIEIEDIAHALAHICRFNGHTTMFYSVAEHCVHVAAAAPEGLRLAALLHDAAEAYVVDVPRPLKKNLVGYQLIEDRVMHAVAKRYGLEFPLPSEVKRLDNAILADERDQVMNTPPADWRLTERPLGVVLSCWKPWEAKQEFLFAFEKYGGV